MFNLMAIPLILNSTERFVLVRLDNFQSVKNYCSFGTHICMYNALVNRLPWVILASGYAALVDRV